MHHNWNYKHKSSPLLLSPRILTWFKSPLLNTIGYYDDQNWKQLQSTLLASPLTAFSLSELADFLLSEESCSIGITGFRVTSMVISKTMQQVWSPMVMAHHVFYNAVYSGLWGYGSSAGTLPMGKMWTYKMRKGDREEWRKAITSFSVSSTINSLWMLIHCMCTESISSPTTGQHLPVLSIPFCPSYILATPSLGISVALACSVITLSGSIFSMTGFLMNYPSLIPSIVSDGHTVNRNPM